MAAGLLSNPAITGIFGAAVVVGLLFAMGAVDGFLCSRLASPFRLPGRDGPSTLDDDQLVGALKETVRRLRRRFYRPAVEDGASRGRPRILLLPRPPSSMPRAASGGRFRR